MLSGGLINSFVATLCLVVMTLAGAAGVASAETETPVSQHQTRAGELRLVQQGSVRRLILENKTVYQGTEFLVVYRTITGSGPQDTIIIKDFTGPLYCPAEYRFVSVSSSGQAAISSPVGHCAAKPEVAAKGGTVTLSFRAFGTMPAVTWSYDGKAVRKIP